MDQGTQGSLKNPAGLQVYSDRWAVWAVEERASSEAEQECPVYF